MTQSSPQTRREFLAAAGAVAVAGSLAAPAAAAGLPGGYEVSASLYPWDLHDEGIERILDNLQLMASVNSVYLIALMHYERRPLTSDEFPHNPRRRMFQAEDSRVYWRPDIKRYGRIKPLVSDFDWLREADWLKVMIEAARKRGLKTGVELSHTVIDLDRSKGEFLDCVQKDINGQPRAVYGRSYPICPNSPDARQYVLNLFSDLAANYDLDYAQTCTLPFMPGGAEKGGCFCPSCVRAAKAAGLDLDKIKSVLLAKPEAQPERDQWQKFRYDSIASYYELMRKGLHALKPKIDLRFNDCFPNLTDWGVSLPLLKPHVDSVRIMDYSEQRGNPEAMKVKRAWLTREREGLGKDFPILSAIAVRPKATPALIREGVRITQECGMDGITLGHYDGAEFPMLRAITDGLNEAGIKVPPTLAKKS